MVHQTNVVNLTSDLLIRGSLEFTLNKCFIYKVVYVNNNISIFELESRKVTTENKIDGILASNKFYSKMSIFLEV